MRVYCPTHMVSFDASESGRIHCHYGGHVLARDFPHDDFWGYCCDCRHFWPSAVRGGSAAAASCPACMRKTARRHLCEECNLLAVVSDESRGLARPESPRMTFGKVVIPACPECRKLLNVLPREHACEVVSATFFTARAECPFCGKPTDSAEHAEPPERTPIILCSNCGGQPHPDASHCGLCGHRIHDDAHITDPGEKAAGEDTAASVDVEYPARLWPVRTRRTDPPRQIIIAGLGGGAALMLLMVVWLLATEPRPTYTYLPRTGDPPTFRAATGDVQEVVNREVEKLKQKPGLILFNPAEEMQVGRTEIVEVRIAKAFSARLSEGLKSATYPQIEEIEVGNYMGVVLSGTKDFFSIDLKNRQEKLITDVEYTEWIFEVTPLKQGNPSLFLTAYNVISTPSGEKSHEQRALIREIKVTTTAARTTGVFLKDNWKEIVGVALASGILGLAANWFKRRREAARKPPPWERSL